MYHFISGILPVVDLGVKESMSPLVVQMFKGHKRELMFPGLQYLVSGSATHFLCRYPDQIVCMSVFEKLQSYFW